MTTRFLTITMMLIGVLHAAGFAMPHAGAESCDTMCDSHTQPVLKQESSCCVLGESIKAPQSDHCPMSNGPCRCSARPVNDQEHQEPLPLPSRDRDTLQMVRAPPIGMQIIDFVLPKRLNAVAVIDQVSSKFTHNQLQAILGVWRR